MILDDFAHAPLYFELLPGLRTALEYLRSTDLDTLEPGRHVIDGDLVVASVADYQTKPEGECRWEAHRRHADVQCVVTGRERMGVAPLRTLAADPYDEEKDVLFARGTGDFVTLTPGHFTILFPHDAHMPGVAAGLVSVVRKLVIKIRLAPPATSSAPR